MTHPEAEPMFSIPAIYLVHGNGESATGPVKKLHAVLERHWPGLNFIRPNTCFDDPKRLADVAVKSSCGYRCPKVACSLAWVSAAWSVRDCRSSELGARTPNMQVTAIYSPNLASAREPFRKT